MTITSPFRQSTESCLAGYRVLDLTDEKGYLCGKVLADLGADVIKVEVPDGSLGRPEAASPGAGRRRDGDLFWTAFSSNKRCITLDIHSEKGKELLKRLTETASFLIESFRPGYLEALGLSYETLKQLNSKLIFVAITPFGQSGPYSKFEASDMDVMAMSGLVYGAGEPDGPPVGFSAPFAYLYGSLEAAVGAMIAHHYRQRTGKGQYVDVSTQESCASLLMNFIPQWDLKRTIITRGGCRIRWRSTLSNGLQVVYPCKDGHIVFQVFGGKLGAPGNKRLVEWMDSEEMAPQSLKEIEWEAFDYEKVSDRLMEEITEPLRNFFIKHTKSELFDGFLSRGIMGYPVSSVEDVAQSTQLKSRGFWQQAPGRRDGATHLYPGPFARMSRTPITMRRAAPEIGEHNHEIYIDELGVKPEELELLRHDHVV